MAPSVFKTCGRENFDLAFPLIDILPNRFGTLAGIFAFSTS